VFLHAPTGGLWAVEHSVDGAAQGYTPGRYATEAEALFAAYELARTEMATPHVD
jgi:hypothetical protein